MLTSVVRSLNLSYHLTSAATGILLSFWVALPTLADTHSPDADALYYSEPDTKVQTFGVVVTRPPLQALLTIDGGLDPFRLDANRERVVSLKEVIEIALRSNLNIRVSQ